MFVLFFRKFLDPDRVPPIFVVVDEETGHPVYTIDLDEVNDEICFLLEKGCVIRMDERHGVISFHAGYRWRVMAG